MGTTSSPPPPPPMSESDSTTVTAVAQKADDGRAVYQISLALLAICPTLIALPPRKLDLMTFTLGATLFLSLNHVVSANSTDGQNIYQHLVRRPGSGFQTSSRAAAAGGGVLDENRQQRSEKSSTRGLLEKAWMGDETKGWSERRRKEEQERLQAGESYWDLIMDQVKEVWRGEAAKVEELKETDQQAVDIKKGLKEDEKK